MKWGITTCMKCGAKVSTYDTQKYGSGRICSPCDRKRRLHGGTHYPKMRHSERRMG